MFNNFINCFKNIYLTIKNGAIALSYPPFFIDYSGAEFHAD